MIFPDNSKTDHFEDISIYNGHVSAIEISSNAWNSLNHERQSEIKSYATGFVTGIEQFKYIGL
jgi:hypothetical protein